MEIFNQNSESSFFAKAQRFGKSFMLPIAVLPAAGLSAFLALMIMNATINVMLKITDTLAAENPASVGQGVALGIQTLETGVFGGVVVGIMFYLLHSRFNKFEVPAFLGFFGGSRFIPIITSFAAIFLEY